jgi:prepilin peptidase CpaA
MELVWAGVFLAVTAPFALLCAANDLTQMRIPNWVVLALGASFLVLAPFAMSWSDFGIRLVQCGVVFVIGYVLNMVFGVGGGDAKFATASALYIAPGDYNLVIMMLAVLALVSVVVHRLFGRIVRFQSEIRNWASYNSGKKFPYGLPLAATLVCYHMLQLFRAL